MEKITLPPIVVNFCYTVCHQAFRNEKRIKYAKQCACYYCEKFFKKEEITEWCDSDGGTRTARCPYCSIDSVMDDNETPGLYPPLVRLAHFVLFGDHTASGEDLSYIDLETGKKVYFDVIDQGEYFEIKTLDNLDEQES